MVAGSFDVDVTKWTLLTGSYPLIYGSIKIRAFLNVITAIIYSSCEFWKPSIISLRNTNFSKLHWFENPSNDTVCDRQYIFNFTDVIDIHLPAPPDSLIYFVS